MNGNQREIEARDQLIDALQTLLAHYRIGSRPKGSLLDRISSLNKEVMHLRHSELGYDDIE